MSQDNSERIIQNSAEELAALARRIEELWKKNARAGQPYLVSALGIALGDDLARLKTLTRNGLTAFIQQHLSDKVQLIRVGAHSNVDALIAAGGEVPDVAAAPLGQPRFHYRFWSAFAVPPKSGRRLLNLNDFTFMDDDGEPRDLPSDKITIDPGYIAPAEIADRDEVIKANIDRWLSQNKLSAERFYQKASLEHVPRGRPLRGTSVLEAMIGALDRRQLQATQLSLDVVAELLKTYVG